jgi:isopropylmalate/homocitrate/citramalate synthase
MPAHGPRTDDMKLALCDVTLREGDQAPLVNFTVSEKVRIATALCEAGVDLLQFGDYARDGETVRRLRAEGLPARVEMVCLAFGADWHDGVRRAVACGADIIQTIVRSSDVMLSQMSVSRQQVLEQACAHIEFARQVGAKGVTFAPSFCFAADPDLLELLCTSAVAAGASRVNLVDTMGTARPGDFTRLVGRIRDIVDVPIGVGAHNDFGLAVSYVIEGALAGATWADVSLNGLGERAGHASLEQVAAAMVLLQGYEIKLDLARLTELCSLAAQILGTDVPATAPIVGSHAFAQRLESHVRVAAERPELFEPFPPDVVGNARQLVIGKGSGPVAVQSKMTALGYSPAPPEALEEIVAWIAGQIAAGKRFLTDDEFGEYLEVNFGLRHGQP